MINTSRRQRIGIDARFVVDSEHPHGALLRELLKDNARLQHPFDYILFHAIPIRRRLPWLDQSNVDLVLNENPGLGERAYYWRIFDRVAAQSRLNLFISPFYRIPFFTWLIGTPVLHIIHDVSQLTVSPSLLPDRFQSSWKRFQVYVGFLICTRLARRTITVSQHAADEIRQVLRLSPTRLVVIPNCIDSEDLESRSNIANLPEGRYLLFVGTNMPKKNLAGLLKAWPLIQKNFPDVKLVVRSSLGINEKNTCAEGIDICDEYLPQEELHALILGASGLVLPSFHEGFGLPVLEAMSLGVPVCVSKGTALEEVAGSTAFLFDPLSPSSIAEACIKLLSLNPVQWHELSRLSRLRAEHFSSRAILPALVNLILESSKDSWVSRGLSQVVRRQPAR